MRHELYDLAILGCGPAGLSAGINASIRNKKVIIIGAETCSPPMHKAQKINNYLGMPDLSGEELLQKFMRHAQIMDLEMIHVKAEAINQTEGVFNILSGQDLISSRTIVIATGVPYRTTLPREDYFLGKGLGYCATCDGPIYRDKDVLIIAHSQEAEHEANFMAEICSQVYYLPLYKTPQGLDSRIKLLHSRPQSIIGEEYVEGLLLEDNTSIQVEGLFVLGAETSPDRLIPGVEIENNHIKVNRNQETNISGVYAAGDCTGAPYQIAKSVGEGQVAGLNAARYAAKK